MEQPNVIPPTQRPDGTWRKEIKIKPGYTPPDQIKKYVVPMKRNENSKYNVSLDLESTPQVISYTHVNQQSPKHKLQINDETESVTNHEQKEEAQQYKETTLSPSIKLSAQSKEFIPKGKTNTSAVESKGVSTSSTEDNDDEITSITDKFSNRLFINQNDEPKRDTRKVVYNSKDKPVYNNNSNNSNPDQHYNNPTFNKSFKNKSKYNNNFQNNNGRNQGYSGGGGRGGYKHTNSNNNHYNNNNSKKDANNARSKLEKEIEKIKSQLSRVEELEIDKSNGADLSGMDLMLYNSKSTLLENLESANNKLRDLPVDANSH
ncbi:protein kinase [Tieghemostelium lacteum]|uniref:Protein kinase n=1 Tax=Tieghemostelium lacteum TaxID=361077 RepID=A0A151ZHE4_TIELA|nr:protein kinase [Tieghemostelium lacteum]|eukprot:KYQ93284.1 protein kinase [Tieghemostelium lacteum]